MKAQLTKSSDARFLDDDVRIGNVSGMHGIRGEVKLFVYNPDSTLLDSLTRVTLVGPQGERRQVPLSVRRGAGLRVLGQIDGVKDREQAAALMGWELVVHADELPPAGADSWYHRDLMGLAVRNASGRELGRIREIHSTGEVDVWVLSGAGGQRLLPVLEDSILQVELSTPERPGYVLVTDDAVDDRPPI